MAHNDNPEWTKEDFAKARPASELLPHLVAAHNAAPARMRKVPISIRLEPATLEFFRSLGEGWQTVMNDLLTAAVKVMVRTRAKQIDNQGDYFSAIHRALIESSVQHMMLPPEVYNPDFDEDGEHLSPDVIEALASLSAIVNEMNNRLPAEDR